MQIRKVIYSGELECRTDHDLLVKGYYGVYEELFSRLDRQESEAEAADNGRESSREPAPRFGEACTAECARSAG